MMLLSLAPCLLLLTSCFAEDAPKNETSIEPRQNDDVKSQLIEATPLKLSENEKGAKVPLEVKEFFERQQFTPEIYGLTYVQPQGGQASLARLQPQIVLYGPGGQGQPILINPGNPPGNFLFPQGPGTNVLVRRNHPAPQGPLFPVAGYPKPAHVPPIEKDAEEIPTNPSKIPPFVSEKPKLKPKTKPEKLETFTEPNLPEQNTRVFQGPQLTPETVSLRPGQRFFFLNGDNLFNYPVEEQAQIQNDFPVLRYTQVQQSPYPQKFLQPFAQEPPQFVQDIEGDELPISVPNLLLRTSFVNNQQDGEQPKPQPVPKNQGNGDGILRTAQQYFRTGGIPNSVLYTPPGLPYFSDQPGAANIQGLGVRGAASEEVVQPQFVGQFKFTPSAPGEFYQYRDDVENDAVVVDAQFDAATNSDRSSGGSFKAEESETASQEPEEIKKDSEPTMAQAGPQATAIAGPGGVAGSAPRATAIVGKGGLAVSSPHATAVSGTKDEDKKSKPPKKET